MALVSANDVSVETTTVPAFSIAALTETVAPDKSSVAPSETATVPEETSSVPAIVPVPENVSVSVSEISTLIVAPDATVTEEFSPNVSDDER